MSCFILQVVLPDEPDPKLEMPEDIMDFNGSFIVDNHIATSSVVMTRDMLGRARRFNTKEEAEIFSDLSGLRDIPTRVIRVDGINAHSSGLRVD